MITSETLSQVVASQRRGLAALELGVKRECAKALDLGLPYALVLTGIRRCGKSTLLRQLMRRAKSPQYYFNFDDSRIAGFEAGDFWKLDAALVAEYGKCSHYFLDEVQSAPGWELFARTKLDEGKKFVITGSNASLLGRELGTKLTGRHLNHELFPFSYGEMLALTGKKPGPASFGEYLEEGGFPEYLKDGLPQALQELFSDVISRDILVRHKIRNAKTAREMALYLLSNAGKEFSYNGLKKTFSLGSANSAISFVSHFEDSYLLFTIPKFDYSLKKQLVNQKKAYSIDNGLSNANSASFSKDRGRMLENAVFLRLRSRHRNIFYYRQGGECDFLVKERERITKAVQVCYRLDEDNKAREIGGMAAALEEFGLHSGIILTMDQDDEFTVGKKKITVKQAWKWMLED
jgi:predicted AAA+ superfamily ATPase